jgi:hypothetical protein
MIDDFQDEIITIVDALIPTQELQQMPAMGRVSTRDRSMEHRPALDGVGTNPLIDECGVVRGDDGGES